jgi:hypothetical protein
MCVLFTQVTRYDFVHIICLHMFFVLTITPHSMCHFPNCISLQSCIIKMLIQLLTLLLAFSHLSTAHKQPLLCRLPKDVGFMACARSPLTVYYYNSNERQCEEFMFYGCAQGNANKFDTLEECERVCGTIKGWYASLIACLYSLTHCCYTFASGMFSTFKAHKIFLYVFIALFASLFVYSNEIVYCLGTLEQKQRHGRTHTPTSDVRSNGAYYSKSFCHKHKCTVVLYEFRCKNDKKFESVDVKSVLLDLL